MYDLETLKSLAKIELLGEETKIAHEYFDNWLKKFDMLGDIDTENIEPLVSVCALENVVREDISKKMVDIETLLENAPEQYNGYFVVPRILE